jgi:5-methyltetrahydrofolate--homocysteine methyltransferase
MALFGKYPAILTDDVVGEATSVFDAQEMLSYFERKKLTAKGIYGIFPANQVNDDDIELTPQPLKVELLQSRCFNFKTASPKTKELYRFI